MLFTLLKQHHLSLSSIPIPQSSINSLQVGSYSAREKKQNKKNNVNKTTTSPVLRGHRALGLDSSTTGWIELVHVTNSQVAAHESWLVGCSPHAPGISLMKQSALGSMPVSALDLEPALHLCSLHLHQRQKGEVLNSSCIPLNTLGEISAGPKQDFAPCHRHLSADGWNTPNHPKNKIRPSASARIAF